MLDSISSPEDIWAKYQYLKNNQWIDDATVNIKIRFDLWNPEIRHGGWMCSTLMVFSMQPGGLVYSTITSVAFPAFPSPLALDLDSAHQSQQMILFGDVEFSNW